MATRKGIVTEKGITRLDPEYDRKYSDWENKRSQEVERIWKEKNGSDLTNARGYDPSLKKNWFIDSMLNLLTNKSKNEVRSKYDAENPLDPEVKAAHDSLLKAVGFGQQNQNPADYRTNKYLSPEFQAYAGRSMNMNAPSLEGQKDQEWRKLKSPEEWAKYQDTIDWNNSLLAQFYDKNKNDLPTYFNDQKQIDFWGSKYNDFANENWKESPFSDVVGPDGKHHYVSDLNAAPTNFSGTGKYKSDLEKKWADLQSGKSTESLNANDLRYLFDSQIKSETGKGYYQDPNNPNVGGFYNTVGRVADVDESLPWNNQMMVPEYFDRYIKMQYDNLPKNSPLYQEGFESFYGKVAPAQMQQLKANLNRPQNDAWSLAHPGDANSTSALDKYKLAHPEKFSNSSDLFKKYFSGESTQNIPFSNQSPDTRAGTSMPTQQQQQQQHPTYGQSIVGTTIKPQVDPNNPMGQQFGPKLNGQFSQMQKPNPGLYTPPSTNGQQFGPTPNNNYQQLQKPQQQVQQPMANTPSYGPTLNNQFRQTAPQAPPSYGASTPGQPTYGNTGQAMGQPMAQPQPQQQQGTWSSLHNVMQKPGSLARGF